MSSWHCIGTSCACNQCLHPTQHVQALTWPTSPTPPRDSNDSTYIHQSHYGRDALTCPDTHAPPGAHDTMSQSRSLRFLGYCWHGCPCLVACCPSLSLAALTLALACPRSPTPPCVSGRVACVAGDLSALLTRWSAPLPGRSGGRRTPWRAKPTTILSRPDHFLAEADVLPMRTCNITEKCCGALHAFRVPRASSLVPAH